MNINELLKGLYDTIKESGWLDEANKYFHEHPEKFHDCVNSSGKIAGLMMSVSYQPETLGEVATVNPSVFISCGNLSRECREYNIYGGKYCNGTVSSRTHIDGMEVVDVSYRSSIQ